MVGEDLRFASAHSKHGSLSARKVDRLCQMLGASRRGPLGYAESGYNWVTQASRMRVLQWSKRVGTCRDES